LRRPPSLPGSFRWHANPTIKEPDTRKCRGLRQRACVTDARVTRTVNGGAEVADLLKAGSAYYAPAASAVEMVEAILKDKKKILPCSAYLEEYRTKGLYVGVPVKLGRRGVEQIIEITLTPDEQAAFDKSAAAVRELVDKLKL
jgi:malate dehydrogenase